LLSRARVAQGGLGLAFGARMRTVETFQPLLCALVTAVVLALAAGCSASADPQTPTSGDTSETRETTSGAPLPPSGGDVGDPGPTGDAPMTPADESVPPTPGETLAGASEVETTANLNLRKAPSTSAAILAVIPSGTIFTLLDTSQTNGFDHVSYDGTDGWAYSAYLVAVTPSPSAPPSPGSPSTGGDPNGPPSVANAIARAQAAVGFSYWWGGGAWLAGGPTASTRGSCSGSCPSCSHSGSYGADCSGMVAKAWELGATDLATDSHPYTTSSFVVDAAGQWSTVSRSALRAGDAMVYNSGGAGHIALWESGDGWGTSTVYECRGCAYGCVHDARTFTASYHGIRRAGF
jgi:uncharacterized protein YraI